MITFDKVWDRGVVKRILFLMAQIKTLKVSKLHWKLNTVLEGRGQKKIKNPKF